MALYYDLPVFRDVYRANKAKGKREYLEAFLDDFEILKLEIRLCVDLKILAIKKQAGLSVLLESIGKNHARKETIHRADGHSLSMFQTSYGCWICN